VVNKSLTDVNNMTPNINNKRVSDIRLSLVGLVIIAVLPLMIFGIGIAWIFVEQKKTSIADNLKNTASALLVAVDHELLSQFPAMIDLSSDMSIESSNPIYFQKRTKQLLKTNNDWLNVVLIDPRTHKLILSAIPTTNPVPASISPISVDQVAMTGKPLIVGAFKSTAINNDPMILLMNPVFRDGKVRYVLCVAMNPKTISGIFGEQHFKTSWTGAVLDNQMKISGRSREPANYIGNQATQTLSDHIKASSQGMFVATNQEGNLVYTVFSRSEQTRWTVAIGIPAAEVEGPIRKILLQLTLIGSSTILFALFLASLVGRGIVLQRNTYEKVLVDSESRFRNLANSAPVMIWISDTDKLCTWVNQIRLNFTGRTIEQELELGWKDNIHPDDSVRRYEEFAAAFDTRQPFSIVFRMHRADEEYRWILENGIPIYENNAFKGYVCSGIDITERKQAEIALIARESDLAAAQALSHIGSWSLYLDEHGEHWSGSKELYAIYEYPLSMQLTMQTGFERIHPEDEEYVQASWSSALTGDGPQEWEHRIIINDQIKWINVRVNFKNVESGKLEANGTIQDITARKLAEDTQRIIKQELFESNARLLKLTDHMHITIDEEKKKIAREVHDELGMAMTTLKFDLAWLQRNYPPEKEEVANRINSMEATIHTTIKSIRRIVTQLRPVLLDDADLIAAVEWHTREFENRTGIKCTLQIEAHNLSLSKSDSVNMFRIFQESLTNILRHSNATNVAICLNSNKIETAIKISDNGKGVSDKEILSSISYGIQGMKERARLSGGEITILGIPGKGTTIHVSIPNKEGDGYGSLIDC
jgi:PAS domain S-box-containing protein